MQKDKIVRRFLEEGILLSPQTLESIDDADIEGTIQQARKEKCLVFGTKKAPYELVIEKITIKDRLQPADMASFYKKKFEGLKRILETKVEAVSINRAGKAFGSATIIGMVSEILPNGFVVEDTTGAIDVMSKDKPDIDDVIAVKGVGREGKFFASEIIFPDISILRKTRSIDMSITFLDEQKESGADICFSFEPLKDCNVLPNPGHIRLKKGEESMYIIAYRPPFPITCKKAADLLKKRHLQLERNQIGSDKDSFIMADEPEIIWLHSNAAEKFVYKGTLIVSGQAIINLRTKEVEFIQHGK